MDAERRRQVQGDGTSATAMLGLAGSVLLALSEYAIELEQAVENGAVRGRSREKPVDSVPAGRRREP